MTCMHTRTGIHIYVAHMKELIVAVYVSLNRHLSLCDVSW